VGTPALTAPANLTYGTTHAMYAVDVAISPNVPTSSGGAIEGYRVTPTLPTGLALAGMTGVISGAPTVLQAAADYVVTAENAAGATSATISIEVKELAAPSGLTYGVASVGYGTPGTDIAALEPTSTGGPIASFGVDHTLPAGLALDPESGRIFGRPTAAAAAADYLITGSNDLGDTSTTLTITVFAATMVTSPQEVSISGMAFHPAALNLAVGETVKWTNSDSANHNATSTASPQAWTQVVAYGSGGSQFLTVNAAGTFPYKCSVHPSMTGTLSVAP